MSDYLKACAVEEVPDEGALRVIVGGIPLALVRSEGQVYAIFDVCSHQDVPLSEGDVEEGTIECWLHGSRFDLSTGRPTSLPATRPVPVYPVKIDGDDVLVALQES